MSDKWIVEVFKHSSYLKRRVFRSRADAVDFVNSEQDRLEDAGKFSAEYDFQIVHNATVETTGINGNNR